MCADIGADAAAAAAAAASAPQFEMLQAVEEHNAQDLSKVQQEADTARARASTAESRAAESASKVASLTQELAAAEAALAAARREGQEALETARVQYEADLQQEQQKLGQAKGAVRKREEELTQRIAGLEVRQGGSGEAGCGLGGCVMASSVWLVLVWTGRRNQHGCGL
jgi:chromosome segregation ATPase